ncbi:MAG: nuclear transport factor 2 family protein [Myxococcota bacterium]
MDKSAALTKANLGITPGLPLDLGSGSPEELRRGLQMLLDIEAIKQLKHAYFRCMDTADFDELASLYHENIKVHYVGGFYEWKLEGRDELIASQTQSFHQRAVGHHNGHQPEIQILSDTEATGLWYLSDNMWILDANFFTTGTALYWDRYEKVDGRWLIRETSYRRIYEISQPLEEAPKFSAHYLGEHGPPAPTAK